MFKWDGTDVTNIIVRSDIYEAEYGKHKYWVIKNKNNDKMNTVETNIPKMDLTETCLVRTAKSTSPCLIDELKPVFGLQKLGTHWCKQGGKTRILVRCVKTAEGYIKQELRLDQVEVCPPLLKLQVQEVFAFRELLGVTCSYSSSVIIREGRNSVYPISFYEPNMLITDKKTIPFTVLEKWFTNSSIDIVVKRLCKIHTIDKLGMVLHNLRGRIESVIERVDRRAITYKACIMNRITERLQTTLVLNDINKQ